MIKEKPVKSKDVLILTNEQKKLIKKLYGEDVEKLGLAVEEFNIRGAGKGVMRVLKVDNVATVSGLSVVGVAN